MRIITISREFGSGGRELGKRLAEELGFDYYDREIISAISQNQGLDEKYVENTLENQGWRNIPIAYRQSFTSYLSINNSKINILVEQKKVIEKIASLNKDFVIVGQNADIILSEYKPFNIFVCASMESKIKRCEERANENEKLTKKEIEKNIKRIDKNRSKNREIVTNKIWGDRESYHLIINTTNWEIKKLVPVVKYYVINYWGQ